MARIQKIKQEQPSWMEYLSNGLDWLVDVQKENAEDRMLQLREEKNKLYEHKKKS